MMKKIKKIILIVLLMLIVFFIIINVHLKLNKKSRNYTTKMKKNRPTVFCFVLSSIKNINTKLKTIYETWTRKCDNFKFIASLEADYLKAAFNLTLNNSNYINETLSKYNIFQPPGLVHDTYGKLTDKVYFTIKYLYNNHNDYDWYLKADDDTFVFVDNLRKFVSDKNSSSPVTYGYDFKVLVPYGYHSGGGGYLLSNQALKRLGSKLNENYTFCPNSGMWKKILNIFC